VPDVERDRRFVFETVRVWKCAACAHGSRLAINASPEIARNLLSRGDGTVAGLTGQAITDAAREVTRLHLLHLTRLANGWCRNCIIISTT
jgi:hypothetical protein